MMVLPQMEKYSKHLEQLVGERTEELEAEKERATILLYSEPLWILYYRYVSLPLSLSHSLIWFPQE